MKVSAAETSRYAAAEATKRFTISKPLDAPTGLAWSTTTPGQATWGAVTKASGYSVQLYKDGSAQGSPATTSGTSYDFANTITQAGSYTLSSRPLVAALILTAAQAAKAPRSIRFPLIRMAGQG